MFSFVKCLRISLGQANESRDEVGKQHLDGSKCMDILCSQYCSQYVWKRESLQHPFGVLRLPGADSEQVLPSLRSPKPGAEWTGNRPRPDHGFIATRTVAGKLFSYLAHLSPNNSFIWSRHRLSRWKCFFPRIAVYCRVCSYQQFCWPTFCNHDSGLLQSQNRTSQLCLSATRCACGRVDWRHVLD